MNQQPSRQFRSELIPLSPLFFHPPKTNHQNWSLVRNEFQFISPLTKPYPPNLLLLPTTLKSSAKAHNAGASIIVVTRSAITTSLTRQARSSNNPNPCPQWAAAKRSRHNISTRKKGLLTWTQARVSCVLGLGVIVSVRPRFLGWHRFNPPDGRLHMSENGSRRVPEWDRRDGMTWQRVTRRPSIGTRVVFGDDQGPRGCRRLGF